MTIRPKPQGRATLYKRDFSQGAIELGVWDALTNDDKSITEVEVLVVSAERDEAEDETGGAQ